MDLKMLSSYLTPSCVRVYLAEVYITVSEASCCSLDRTLYQVEMFENSQTLGIYVNLSGYRLHTSQDIHPSGLPDPEQYVGRSNS